ncbi:MAG: hypothetical protein NVSMB65_19830 [Chloroflexota bacterium]
MTTRTSRRVAGLLALSVALLASGGAAQAARTKGPTWVSTHGKTVNVTLVAGWNNTLGGFNFNGAGNGKWVLTVPQGDTVKVTFWNNQVVPHSAQVIAFTKPLPTAAVADAFRGAHTPNPLAGIGKGPKQSFSFVANKAGTYMIICAVPGHDAAGMWDTLVVSRSAKTASATLK